MKYILASLVLVGIIIFGYLVIDSSEPAELSVGTAINKVATELIGTRTASSTSPVGFYAANAASTTYPFFVGDSSTVSVALNAINASSSAANVQLSIFGSNDYGCNTATTSTIYNLLTKGEVKWFDAGQYLAGASAPTSLSAATTTLIWTNPVAGTGKVLNFDNLNVECLAIQVCASSTELFAEFRTK